LPLIEITHSILGLFQHTMKKNIAFFALLLCFSFSVMAQSDTCVIALRIDDKNIPFEIKPDKDGHYPGLLTKSTNGNINLYTNKKIIKVVNESSSEMRDKNTGQYRVITFEKGSAITFDYSNKGENGKWQFAETNVRNFVNSIYFGGDIKENTFSFLLENNNNFRRTLYTRSSFGEFDGLKNISITVSKNGIDSTFVFKESDKIDTLFISSSDTIISISATRGRNGMLNALLANEEKLATNYTYRNKDGIYDEDNYTVRSTTIKTSEQPQFKFPCTLSVVYSYIEGDNNIQTDSRKIYIDVKDDGLSEGSNAWLWILILLVLGGGGYYFYHRHQLKKAGIIPETDGEKISRLQKEVASHLTTIKNLKETHFAEIQAMKQTESDLLNDKSSLLNQVSKLNSDLDLSRQETKDKTSESLGFKSALENLQAHAEDIQNKLNTSLDRIKVFESGETVKENSRLNQKIEDLIQEMEYQKKCDDEAMRDALLAQQQKTEQEIAEIKASTTKQIEEVKAEAAAMRLAADKEISEIQAKAQCDINEIITKSEQKLATTKAAAAKELSEAKSSAEKLLADTKAEAERIVNETKTSAAKEIAETKANAEATITETKSSADKIVAETKAYASQEISKTKEESAKAIKGTQDAAAKEVAETKAEADRIVTETKTSAAKEIAEIKANAEVTIAEMKSNADNIVAETKAYASQEISKTKEESAKAIKDTQDAAAKEVAETKTDAENQISTIKENCAKQISELKEDCINRIAEEEEKTRKANATIAEAGDEFITFIKSSIDKIFDDIKLLHEENSASPIDNNHKNVINHLTIKFTGFHQWFERNIVEAQDTKRLGIKQIQEAILAELLPTLTNNYSWMSELTRFYCYTSINKRFTNEFRKSFVPVDLVKSSYAEARTLFGKLGVTLFIPHLFVDDFNKELYKLNNTPLINSYYPQGFIEFKTENRGLIYDMLHPGYSINGEVKQLPEVCVF